MLAREVKARLASSRTLQESLSLANPRKGRPSSAMMLHEPSGSRRPVFPQRTMSKFREDLPELPLSPPDSRVQSPETTMIQPGAGSSLSSKQQPQSLMGTLDTRSLATSSRHTNLGQGEDLTVVFSLCKQATWKLGHPKLLVTHYRNLWHLSIRRDRGLSGRPSS